MAVCFSLSQKLPIKTANTTLNWRRLTM
jgi:hypothetical protein